MVTLVGYLTPAPQELDELLHMTSLENVPVAVLFNKTDLEVKNIVFMNI